MRLAMVAAGLLLLAGGALAALSVTSNGSIAVSVRDPPVVFELGDGAAKSRYVSNAVVSPNGTAFSATVQGRLGGDASVKSVVEVVSASNGTRSVTLRGTQVTNPNVPIHTWTVRSGSATVATLDMRAASPSATFTIGPGETYALDMRVKVVRGVAASEAAFSSEAWGVVS